MEGLSILERLSRNLSPAERSEFLRRLQKSVPFNSEPLAAGEEEPEVFDPDRELRRLGFWQRLLLALAALFTRKDRRTLVKRMLLRRVQEQIAASGKGLMDFRRGSFTAGMFDALQMLSRAAAVLREPLAQALGRERRDFVACLAGSELSDFQQRLEADTNPYELWERRGSEEEVEVRAEMLARFDQLFEAVPAGDRKRVQRELSVLNGLLALSRQPYDSMLARFTAQPGKEAGCPFRELTGALKSLAVCLQAVQLPPSPETLYNLFVFVHQAEDSLAAGAVPLKPDEAEPGPELGGKAQAVARDIARAEEALQNIRSFNRRVPLVLVVRYVTEQLDFSPFREGGGEDWFVLYRDYWRTRVERSYRRFLSERNRERLAEQAARQLGRIRLPELETYRSNHFGRDILVRHALSMAFLRGFTQGPFSRMVRPLKLIVINGDFYKEDNRHAFTDAFNFVSKLEETIDALERRLGPEGDLRSRIQEVRNRPGGDEKRRLREIEEILSWADVEAKAIAEQSVEQMRSLAVHLDGILHGEPGAQHDTLANRTTLGGSENPELRAAWERARETLEASTLVLEEILTLELAPRE